MRGTAGRQNCAAVGVVDRWGAPHYPYIITIHGTENHYLQITEGDRTAGRLVAGSASLLLHSYNPGNSRSSWDSAREEDVLVLQKRA